MWKLLGFLIALIACSATNAAHTDYRLRSNTGALYDDTEMVYFFSYHCPGCHAMHETINVWSFASPEFRRVPVVTSEGKFSSWDIGATVYFVLRGYSQHIKHLDDMTIDKIGFILSNEDDSEQWRSRNKTFIHKKLSEWHLDASSEQIDSILVYVDKMVSLSIMVSDAQSQSELVTPMFRVYRPGKGESLIRLSKDSDDPAIDFIQKADREYKALSKD